MEYTPEVSIPSFLGSSLSLLAATSMLTLHLIRRPKWHFRHALIINAFIANIMNALNNTVSGIVVFANANRLPSPLLAGPACNVNGFLGQLSSQAFDFNILVISAIVLLVILDTSIVADPTKKKTILYCLIPWIPSIITSIIGLALHAYGPVSGNWCWIVAKRSTLRYALNYAWRIFTWLAAIAVYSYLYFHVKRRYRDIRHLLKTSSTLPDTLENNIDDSADTCHILQNKSYSVHIESAVNTSQEAGEHPCSANTSITSPTVSHYSPSNMGRKQSRSNTPSAASPTERRTHTSQNRGVNMRKMFLLNGYPFIYIILWTPDMANRLSESFGHSPRWLQALQATGQFVGAANAVLYYYNEHMRVKVDGKP